MHIRRERGRAATKKVRRRGSVNTLSEFACVYVKPVLRSAGFRAAGNTFHLAASNRDLAIVGCHAFTPDPDFVSFFVETSVAPMPFIDWLFRGGDDRGRPSVAWGRWRERLQYDRVSTL